MRYPAAEKLEIIRLVEQSPLPVRATLEKLGISRATFYRYVAAPVAGNGHVSPPAADGKEVRDG